MNLDRFPSTNGENNTYPSEEDFSSINFKPLCKNVLCAHSHFTDSPAVRVAP